MEIIKGIKEMKIVYPMLSIMIMGIISVFFINEDWLKLYGVLYVYGFLFLSVLVQYIYLKVRFK